MKKLVIFTVVMVLALAGAAFAFVDENAVGVLGAQAATTGGENTAIDAQGNPVAVNGSQAATNDGLNVAVSDVLKSNTNNLNFYPTDSLNDNSTNVYVVDNAILANVNVKGDSFFGAQTGSNTLNKTQASGVNGSFNFASGVSNVNSAAGNLNSQAAFTTISIGNVGP